MKFFYTVFKIRWVGNWDMKLSIETGLVKRYRGFIKKSVSTVINTEANVTVSLIVI
jgi:non-canonical (house-cleaning) NTP pyrophosphatase